MREICSDNGTNLIGGEELRLAIREWNQHQIHNYLLQSEIIWKFNLPTASNQGVWERCIREVGKVLKALVKEQILDDESLSTLLCEVESIVNSRPLTTMSSDSKHLEPLTPNHLLLLPGDPSLPPDSFNKEDLYTRKRWRQFQYLVELFWKCWV